jgi:hypothetical protein
MNKTILRLALASLAIALPGMPAPAFAQTEVPPARYSVTATKIGALIDDPASAAILKAMIPTIWANEMFQSLGRDLALKDVQQYEPALTDEKLAEIQAALDKLPQKP